MFVVKRAILLLSVFALLMSVNSASSAPITPNRRWSIRSLALLPETISTGEQRSWTFRPMHPDTVLLSIEARLDWPNLAGTFQAMQIEVNHVAVTADFLINKPLIYTLADGRQFSYYQLPTPDVPTPGWSLPYSPDFESNNTPGALYQFLEGQAYLYTFDITPLVHSGKMTTIILTNRSEVPSQILGQPISLVFRQAKLLVRGDTIAVGDKAQ